MRAISRRKIAAIGLTCLTTFSGVLVASSAQVDDLETTSAQLQQSPTGKNVVANITVFAPTDVAFAKFQLHN